jgi:hypothetical protein
MGTLVLLGLGPPAGPMLAVNVAAVTVLSLLPDALLASGVYVYGTIDQGSSSVFTDTGVILRAGGRTFSTVTCEHVSNPALSPVPSCLNRAHLRRPLPHFAGRSVQATNRASRAIRAVRLLVSIRDKSKLWRRLPQDDGVEELSSLQLGATMKTVTISKVHGFVLFTLIGTRE